MSRTRKSTRKQQPELTPFEQDAKDAASECRDNFNAYRSSYLDATQAFEQTVGMIAEREGWSTEYMQQVGEATMQLLGGEWFDQGE